MMKLKKYGQFLTFVATSAVAIGTEDVLYDQGHVDIDIAINQDSTKLEFNTVFDENLNLTQPIDSSVYVGNELSEIEITQQMNTAFPWLGSVGDMVYNFPVNNVSGMIWLGLSSYTTDSTMFESTFIDLNYLDLQGPGNFFVNVGSNAPRIDSTGTLGAPQTFLNLPGGHEHLNWWFTERGLYKVTVQAKGVLSNDSPIESDPTDLRFMVYPYPHELWLVELFGFNLTFDGIDLTELGPNGRPLLLDYAFNMDPYASTSDGLPVPVTVNVDNSIHPGLIYRAPEGRTDILYIIEGSTDLQTWETLTEDTDYTLEPISPSDDGTPRNQAVLNDAPIDGRYFFRMSVELLMEE